jgi:hypothetical protein
VLKPRYPAPRRHFCQIVQKIDSPDICCEFNELYSFADCAVAACVDPVPLQQFLLIDVYKSVDSGGWLGLKGPPSINSVAILNIVYNQDYPIFRR